MFSVKYFLMRKLSHIDKCNSETMCGGYILGFFLVFWFLVGFFLLATRTLLVCKHVQLLS